MADLYIVFGGELGATHLKEGLDLPPVLTPIDPVDLQTAVPTSSNIRLSIIDDASVALNTVLVRVDVGDGNGYVMAFEGYGSPQFKPGWDGPNSSVTIVLGGYEIVIDPTGTLPGATSVSVEVTALDGAGNGVT